MASSSNGCGIAVDDRGVLQYVSSVPFERIKRFYVVENFDLGTVRAFHGHFKEEKYVYVVSGSAMVVIANMQDFHPDGLLILSPQRTVLSEIKPEVLHIPAGKANGFRSLSPGTKIMFFSTATADESKEDDYRFPFDYFGKKIWETESR